MILYFLFFSLVNLACFINPNGLYGQILSPGDRNPWIVRQYDLDIRGTGSFQSYRSVNGVCGKGHHPSSGFFLFFSGDVSPCENWEMEGGIIASNTSDKEFGIDSFRGMGKYQLLNDIIEDSLSLALGACITKVCKKALGDKASFYHGGIEGELFVSYGKELSCQQFWTSRIWGVTSIGFADLGSPWFRGDLNWEYNWWDTHCLALFAYSLQGFGSRALNLSKKFHGYGPIGHRSIDLGFRYSMTISNKINLGLEYSRRVFSRYCPIEANTFRVYFTFPHGL